MLATYRTYIGDLKAHIAYSSSDYNVRIIDPRLQVENHRTLEFEFISGQSAFPIGLSDGGSYLLTVFNDNVALASSGMSVTYMLSPSGMSKAREWFGQNYNTITQYFNGTPLSGIMSCIWVPYSIPSEYRTGTSSIEIGNVHGGSFTTGECYIIKGHPIFTKEVDIPIHLRYNNHTAVDFRDQEPYTTGMLFLPGAGFVQISMGDWFDTSYIYCECVIEGNTGNLRYNLWRNVEYDTSTPPQRFLTNLVQTVDCCVAASCALGQIMTNATGTVSSMATMVGGAVGLVGSIAATVASHGAAAPLIAASAGTLIAGAANTALNANQHATSVTGTNGTRMASIYNRYRYYEAVMDMEDPDDSDYIDLKGRPCGKVKKISTLSGFVQCEGASIDCQGSILEKQEINQYLNSGFYYE